jgi:hypothetical protein
MVAALAFLDPVLAPWTLFHLLSLYEVDGGLFIEVGVLSDLELSTSHSLVLLHAAVEAVLLPAHGAVKILGIGAGSVENESHLAVGGRAPRDVFLLGKRIL